VTSTLALDISDQWGFSRVQRYEIRTFPIPHSAVADVPASQHHIGRCAVAALQAVAVMYTPSSCNWSLAGLDSDQARPVQAWLPWAPPAILRATGTQCNRGML